MNMVHLFITLSTGSLALTIGLLRFDASRAFQGKGWLTAGLVALVLALVFSLLWRMLTQVFMEQEVFGNSRSVDAYYTAEGLRPFTSSYRYAESDPFHHICAGSVIICMFCTAVTLPVGLTSIAVFVFKNLP